MTDRKMKQWLTLSLKEAQEQADFWRKEVATLKDALYGLENPDSPEYLESQRKYKDIIHSLQGWESR